MDKFRNQLVKMIDTHREFQKDILGGAGIRPISVESKIRADILDTVLILYDKHQNKSDINEK